MEWATESALVPVRGDLTSAHRLAWERLARPGTWWTGEERIAIAAETRNGRTCSLCQRRKAAVSPSAIQGAHESLGALPDSVVDVIHRIRSDPGRLTKRWCEQVLATGLDDAAYVETVGVVITVVAVDTFARALGARTPPFPEPVSGAPSRIRPASAMPHGAWVPMIAPEDATGPEADLYGERRFVPNIRRALSLVPAEARAFSALSTPHYFAIDEMMDLGRRRAITRPQIELVASRVSALNECFY